MMLLLASPLRRMLVAAALAFAVTLAVLLLAARDEEPSLMDAAGLGVAAEGTDEIGRLQAAVRAAPERADLQAALASAYLQRARETGDPSFYGRADELLRRALARDPRSLPGLVAAATLANAQHDFRGALALAQRARAVAPESAGPYPALVDALVELGRQGAAERSLQEMIDLKPNLAGYARVSYVRELHGDLDGAARAMELAVTAGGGSAENTAAVQVLLGDLELTRGRLGAAGRAYAAALVSVPVTFPRARGARGSPPRRAMPARRGAPGGGSWRRARCPSTPRRSARPSWRPGTRPRRSVSSSSSGSSRRCWRARGPTWTPSSRCTRPITAARGARSRRRGARGRLPPACGPRTPWGWALTRAGRPDAGLRWARRALRLGSVDAGFRYHAGLSAHAAGRPAAARRHLRVALDHALAAHPLRAQRARRVLGTGT